MVKHNLASQVSANQPVDKLLRDNIDSISHKLASRRMINVQNLRSIIDFDNCTKSRYWAQ